MSLPPPRVGMLVVGDDGLEGFVTSVGDDLYDVMWGQDNLGAIHTFESLKDWGEAVWPAAQHSLQEIAVACWYAGVTARMRYLFARVDDETLEILLRGLETI